jgi:tetratricopeptide (TPR) repeat protein
LRIGSKSNLFHEIPYFGLQRACGVATSFGGGGIGSGSPEDNRAWAYYQRGLLYQFSHQSDLAIADYSNAIALRKNYADAYAARADAYAELGDHQHASSDYAQAASANSGDAYDLNRRCWARVVRGHPLDLALADCSEALKRNPNVIEALDSRCFVNYRMGNYAAGISDCTAVLAWRAREASSLFIRGLAKLRSGDVAGGKTDIDAAVDADYRIQEKYAAFDVRQ